MANSSKGTKTRLSAPRKVMVDMLRHAQTVPSIPVAKRLNVSELVMARRQVPGSPSWTTMFIHAYSRVSAEFDILRTVYMPFPTAHFYTHPTTICKMVVERDIAGEKVPMFAELHGSDTLSLQQIGDGIRKFKDTPIQEISAYRQIMRLGRLPRPLRRMFIWKALYLSGAKRCKRMGTFLISNYGQLGAESLHPISTHTTLMNLSPLEPNGDLTVKLVYDHRVTDGAVIARVLTRLNEVLHEETRAALEDHRRMSA